MSPATLAVGQPGLVVDLFAGAGGWSEGLRTLAAPNVATPTCSSSWPTRRRRPVAETLLLDQLTLAPPAAAGLHRVAMADANDLLAPLPWSLP